jgi:hypothetical protein
VAAFGLERLGDLGQGCPEASGSKKMDGVSLGRRNHVIHDQGRQYRDYWHIRSAFFQYVATATRRRHFGKRA